MTSVYLPTFKSGLFTKEDSQFFREDTHNVSNLVESDNGYTIARPTHTRSPKKTIKTGFTELSNIQKKTLDDFFANRYGSTLPFLYIHPVSKETLTVRFANESLSWRYVGIGSTPLWTVEFSMETVIE